VIGIDAPEASQEQADHPVDQFGCFAPAIEADAAAQWMLWRTVPTHRYEAGSEEEAAALRRWEAAGGRFQCVVSRAGATLFGGDPPQPPSRSTRRQWRAPS
jgi:hypothetical protein